MQQFTLRGQRHLRTLVSVLDARTVHKMSREKLWCQISCMSKKMRSSGQNPSLPLLTFYKVKLILAPFLIPGDQHTPLGGLKCPSSCKEGSRSQDTWQREGAFLGGLTQAPSSERAEERRQDFGPRKGTKTQQHWDPLSKEIQIKYHQRRFKGSRDNEKILKN